MAREEKRGFQYRKRSPDDIKERANAKGGNFDSIFKPQFKTYKVRDGKNIIRILPPTWEKAKHYGYDIWVNYDIGVDNQSYLSLSKMKQEKDPLADARKQAESEGREELAKALRPNQRILMWVIDRQDEDEGPLLWAAPFTVDKAFASVSMDEDTKEVVYIDDPETGCDVRFYREGKGKLTKYDGAKIKLLKPGPIHEDEGIQNEWLDFITENPLPEVLQFHDYAHINAVFNGHAGERDKKQDEDADEPPRGRSRPASRKGPDDEDATPPRQFTRRAEPVDEEAPFDEDEPKPAKAASKRATRDPEDDPDEKPARATRRRVDPDDEPEPEPEKEAEGGSLRDRIRRRREGLSKSKYGEDE